MEKQRGIRKVSAPVADGGAATPTNLYLVTPTRSIILRKLWIYNLCGANSVVTIGTGLAVAWAALMPPIFTANGLNVFIGEDEMPALEFNQALGNLTFQATVTGVTVIAEVEEFE